MQTAALFVLLFTAIQSSLIKEYRYINLYKTWEDARLYCKENYTELAFIDSQTDQDLLSAAGGEDFYPAWIGLHQDPDNFTVWKWTGRPGEVTYTNWGPSQPNEVAYTEKKTLVVKDSSWYDVSGTLRLHFFCVRVYGVEETKKSWEEALQHCREAGSNLLSLHSENTSNPTGQSVWVGLRFLAGHWLWVDGKPLWDQAWFMAAAHQCPLSTCCGALSPEGVWEARDCQERLGFICNNPL